MLVAAYKYNPRAQKVGSGIQDQPGLCVRALCQSQCSLLSSTTTSFLRPPLFLPLPTAVSGTINHLSTYTLWGPVLGAEGTRYIKQIKSGPFRSLDFKRMG